MTRAGLSGSPASPLEDENILSEILLRLPARPSTLPRASLVCKQWRSLVSEPYFLRRFRDHHGKPPLLGFFRDRDLNIEFLPSLDPPDLISAARFSPPLEGPGLCRLLSCRHGRVLFLLRTSFSFIVWDPVTGEQRREALPLAFRCKINNYLTINGAVLCAAGDQGHVHGGCHSSPFQVVMLGSSHEAVIACVYSSKTGTWGNVVSLSWPQNVQSISTICPSALVGNSIFWLLTGTSFAIIEFDLCRQSLASIEIPSNLLHGLVTYYPAYDHKLLIAPADDGGLNLIVLSHFRARVWKWKADCCDSVAGWVLRNTIDLSKLLKLWSGEDAMPPNILGLVEDYNAMLLWTGHGIFVVHVESMRFKKLYYWGWGRRYTSYHPFTSFYSTGYISEATHNIGTKNQGCRYAQCHYIAAFICLSAVWTYHCIAAFSK